MGCQVLIIRWKLSSQLLLGFIQKYIFSSAVAVTIEKLPTMPVVSNIKVTELGMAI